MRQILRKKMAPDQLDKYTDYLAWERDALNRLYYGFWVLFMAGFVYSLHIPKCLNHPHIEFWTVLLFRALSIAGTMVNFLMQYHAVGSLGSIQSSQLFD